MADARRSAGRASRAVALPLHVQLAGPIMPTARIYQRAKNAMQSGRARAEEWLLEYEPSEPRRADPLTGWAGSGDTRRQLRLSRSEERRVGEEWVRTGRCRWAPDQ